LRFPFSAKMGTLYRPSIWIARSNLSSSTLSPAAWKTMGRRQLQWVLRQSHARKWGLVITWLVEMVGLSRRIKVSPWESAYNDKGSDENPKRANTMYSRFGCCYVCNG
jgi:hypothetical protein